jgi:hypothetical protein
MLETQCSASSVMEHADGQLPGPQALHAQHSQSSAEPALELDASCASAAAAAAAGTLDADQPVQRASCASASAAGEQEVPAPLQQEQQQQGPAHVQELPQQQCDLAGQHCSTGDGPQEQGWVAPCWVPGDQQQHWASSQPCEDAARIPEGVLQELPALRQLHEVQGQVCMQQQWGSTAQAFSAYSAAVQQAPLVVAVAMDKPDAPQQQQQECEAAAWPEALCAALAAVVAARPAASDADLSDAEGFIYQDDEGSASPANDRSPGAAPASGAASSQAGMSARTSADAAAAALAALSLNAQCAGELSPWETFTEDGCGQQVRTAAQVGTMLQAGPAPAALSSSGGSASPRARKQQHLSPRQQPSPRQQVSPRQQLSPRQHRSPGKQCLQAQGKGGLGADLFAPQAPSQQQQQYPNDVTLPSSIQGHRLLQGLSYHRPSSAPVGGSAAAQHLQRQVLAQQIAGMLPVVAESSQEGACSSRGTCRQSITSQMPSPGRHRPSWPDATANCAATAPQQQQQQQDRDDEQQHRQQLLMRMQQLHMSRPASAEPWQRKQQLVYEQQQQWQHQRQWPQQRQQQGRRTGPAWDDSPMALNVPKWMPIAQAVQLPSPAAAASLAVGGWGSSILGSSKVWPVEAVRGDATRPQTAGPVMLHSGFAWEAGLSTVPHSSGSVTARSASTSPTRRCSNRLPAGTASSGEAGSGTTAVLGCTAESSAPSGLRSPPKTRGSGSSSATVSVRGAGCASVYLLDVQQQVRQANSICRQLGLSTQYLLAQGSSRKDKWQLEQIEIELWELTYSSTSNWTSSSEQEYQQPLQQGLGLGSMSAGAPGSADATAAGAAVAASQWQLRKRLSLPQFTGHLSRLKGLSTAPAPSRVGHAAAPGGGGTAWSTSAAALSGGRRALSAAAGPQAGNRVGGVYGGSRRSSSSNTCQLLVLSPRCSSSGEPMQCMLRPASAPRGCSRLSPRRR